MIVALDPREVADRLTAQGESTCGVHVFESLPSTNAWMLDRRKEFTTSQLCAVETQTQGRGRRGKDWISPPAGVTFSLFRQFQIPATRVAGLSLVTGCAVVSALELFGVQGLQLKWPNDVLIDGKKLSGVLIELSDAGVSSVATVTGIGINYDGGTNIQMIDQPAAKLSDVLTTVPDRNHLIGEVAASVLRAYNVYEAQGFAPFRHQWEARDLHSGCEIMISQVNGPSVTGVARGVDECGALRVLTESGLRTFYSGEVSVRLQA